MKRFTLTEDNGFGDGIIADTEEEAVRLYKETHGTDSKITDIRYVDLILAPFGKESLEGINEGVFSSIENESSIVVHGSNIVVQGKTVYEYGWNFVDEEKDEFSYEINFKAIKGKLKVESAFRVYNYDTIEVDFTNEQIKEIEGIVQKKYDKEYPYERG